MPTKPISDKSKKKNNMFNSFYVSFAGMQVIKHIIVYMCVYFCNINNFMNERNRLTSVIKTEN